MKFTWREPASHPTAMFSLSLCLSVSLLLLTIHLAARNNFDSKAIRVQNLLCQKSLVVFLHAILYWTGEKQQRLQNSFSFFFLVAQSIGSQITLS